MALLDIFPTETFKKNSKVFFLFPVKEKGFPNILRIVSGIFRHCEIDETSTIVSFAFLGTLFERGADFS